MDCCFHTVGLQNVYSFSYCICIDDEISLTVSHTCIFDIINKDAKGDIPISMNAKLLKRIATPLVF